MVAGAGTLACEIEQQAGLPDAVLVSVGGGGLIAGVAAWFGQRARVVALEPELAPTLFQARAAGLLSGDLASLRAVIGRSVSLQRYEPRRMP